MKSAWSPISFYGFSAWRNSPRVWPDFKIYRKFSDKLLQRGPVYFVFCRLHPFSPQVTTAVFGSYLTSLHSSLTMYRRCWLAYPHDGRGFVGPKRKTIPSFSTPSPFPPLSPSPLLPLTPRGIIVYIEYQSVCPFVGIGYPHPLTRKRVCLPPWTQRGEKQHSLACGVGGGTQFWRLYRKPCTLYTLCS